MSCVFTLKSRGVVPGGAGGAMAPPDFGRSVNPISTKGTDDAHLITTPGFSDLPTALKSQMNERTGIFLKIHKHADGNK